MPTEGWGKGYWSLATGMLCHPAGLLLLPPQLLLLLQALQGLTAARCAAAQHGSAWG
jgi:hypothetical protein